MMNQVDQKKKKKNPLSQKKTKQTNKQTNKTTR